METMSNTPLKIDNSMIKKAFYVKFMLPKGLYRHLEICNNIFEHRFEPPHSALP